MKVKRAKEAGRLPHVGDTPDKSAEEMLGPLWDWQRWKTGRDVLVVGGDNGAGFCMCSGDDPGIARMLAALGRAQERIARILEDSVSLMRRMDGPKWEEFKRKHGLPSSTRLEDWLNGKEGEE